MTRRTLWQDVITTGLLDRGLSNGAIIGLDGNIWAKSRDFRVTSGEIKKLLDYFNFLYKSALLPTRFQVAGLQYITTHASGDLLLGWEGEGGGVQVFRTHQAVVLGVYEYPVSYREAALVTGTLGELMREAGL